MKTLFSFIKLTFTPRKEVNMMMVNYFTMQVEFGWITIDEVPKKWREKVRQLLEASKG